MKKDIATISTYESGVVQSAAHRLLMKVKTDFLADYDLTPMQWFVIGFTYDAGESGIHLSELRRKIDASMPFITSLVNNLESKQILQKVSDPSDSRVKIARLDPSYNKKVEYIEEALRDKLREVLYRNDDITRNELQTYITVLYKMMNSKGKES